MAAYRVTRTPGGGYWVSDAEGIVGDAMLGSGAVALGLVGLGVATAVHASRQLHVRRRAQGIGQMRGAADSGDWGLLYELAQEFVRRYPTDQTGYEVLGDAAVKLDSLSPAERLAAAELCQTHGVAPMTISSLRAAAYLDSRDMANLLREANALLEAEGQQRVAGYLARAQALLWLGDLAQALSDANSAVTLRPGAGPYAIRADVRWARGELLEAVGDYTLAVRLAPKEAALLDRRASVYEALGQTDEAAGDRKVADELRRRPPEEAVATVPDVDGPGWRTGVITGAGFGSVSVQIPGGTVFVSEKAFKAFTPTRGQVVRWYTNVHGDVDAVRLSR